MQDENKESKYIRIEHDVQKLGDRFEERRETLVDVVKKGFDSGSHGCDDVLGAAWIASVHS